MHEGGLHERMREDEWFGNDCSQLPHNGSVNASGRQRLRDGMRWAHVAGHTAGDTWPLAWRLCGGFRLQVNDKSQHAERARTLRQPCAQRRQQHACATLQLDVMRCIIDHGESHGERRRTCEERHNRSARAVHCAESAVERGVDSRVARACVRVMNCAVCCVLCIGRAVRRRVPVRVRIGCVM